MFSHTNTITVSLGKLHVGDGRHQTLVKPLREVVAELSADLEVLEIAQMRRHVLLRAEGATHSQFRYALMSLIGTGELVHLDKGLYKAPGVARQEDAAPASLDGMSAGEVLRLVTAGFEGSFCLDEIYVHAERMGSTCSETAIRMAITAAIRDPAPYMTRVGRGRYQRSAT
jgi:hypothetical protein